MYISIHSVDPSTDIGYSPIYELFDRSDWLMLGIGSCLDKYPQIIVQRSDTESEQVLIIEIDSFNDIENIIKGLINSTKYCRFLILPYDDNIVVNGVHISYDIVISKINII